MTRSQALNGRAPHVPTEIPAVRIRVPGRSESITVVRQAVSGLGDAMGWSDEFVADVKVAASEAATNVALHAYRPDAPGPLELHAWVTDGWLTLQIVDEGTGMMPKITGTRKGLGLGLPMMTTLADGFQLARSPNGTTTVTMWFELDRST